MTPEDRPLVGKPQPGKWHPRLYAAELAGTALLVGAGVSIVIAMFGRGGPLPTLLPNVGKVSGAHINPAVTIAFLAEGKLAPRDAAGYVVAQLAGALLAIPALATAPDPSVSVMWAALGDAGITFAMVTLIFMLAAHRRTQPFTPWSIPLLFAAMVWLEAPLSGTSANPARSLGPNLLAGQGGVLWVYFVGPISGALLSVGLLRIEAMRNHHPPSARVAHFHRERRRPRP
jgi:aquaporin Z